MSLRLPWFLSKMSHKRSTNKQGLTLEADRMDLEINDKFNQNSAK